MAGRQVAQPLGVFQPKAVKVSAMVSSLSLRIASRTSWWLWSVQPQMAFFLGVAE